MTGKLLLESPELMRVHFEKPMIDSLLKEMQHYDEKDLPDNAKAIVASTLLKNRFSIDLIFSYILISL
jgi:hypothetical protein